MDLLVLKNTFTRGGARLRDCESHPGPVGAGWPDGGRKAKFYELTAEGTRRLAAEMEQWSHLTLAVRKVLRFA